MPDDALRRTMAAASNWTFLSNHAHVLVCLAEAPDSRLRDVAARVDITERAVQSIVTHLEQIGAITRIRDGRRNRYEIHGAIGLRHPIEAHCTVGDLLAMVLPQRRRGKRTKRR